MLLVSVYYYVEYNTAHHRFIHTYTCICKKKIPTRYRGFRATHTTPRVSFDVTIDWRFLTRCEHIYIYIYSITGEFPFRRIFARRFSRLAFFFSRLVCHFRWRVRPTTHPHICVCVFFFISRSCLMYIL